MSTLPRTVMQKKCGGTLSATALEPFPYDSLGSLNLNEQGPSGHQNPFSGYDPQSSKDDTSSLSQARLQGIQEGRAEAQESFQEHIQKERAALTIALTQFAQERSRYFQAVEMEVVQLALGIAAKVLHRESQLDPLLLAGAVRFSLDKVQGATQVSLRVHPSRKADWERYFGESLQAPIRPEVTEDPTLSPDACVLQTSVGTVQLGVEAQLKEIERSLTDLLSARPAKL